VSLEQLKQEELDLVVEGDYEATPELQAEQELDFESTQEREYEPEVWEVLNETGPSDESD
jgi:hypothetical protein